jgi:ATP-dependent DNA helicase RecQ
MTDSFTELQKILETATISNDISHFTEPCHRRLLDALVDGAVSPGDIASLVRYVLRREDEKQGGSSPVVINVSRKAPFPERKIWEQSSITIYNEDDREYYTISARPWKPEWLEFGKDSPDKPIFKEELRRNYDYVAGDPFLKIVGLDKYRSVGQRSAIQGILTAPSDATLIINLPTGSGKSLCAHLPALLNSQYRGVSVVVVPTTALAIDQEKGLKSIIKHDTAYYSDDSQEGKERREGIRERIREGTQRIIFTSPESLMDSLAPALYEAAKQGMLKYFIIDEAHMVEQWGDDFRPAFQEIPGLRKDLLRLGAFTTLLLTATLTESCLDTLESLFGEDLRVISAVQLRPEPSYWFNECINEEIREERLIEAVYNLPRPLIIYGTKVEDVKRWKKQLARAGFTRCELMTGKSTSKERLELIEKWRDRKIDIVVATSAFGLGIDQADVRAVIHVCVPETIDRFYQEVGRGGRDGKACISLMLYTETDIKIARGINDNSAITVERGLQRWQTMFDRKQRIDDFRYRVPVNTPPSLRPEDIDMDSEQNTAWNIRTLTLMSRANLIEIDFEEPPLKKDFECQSETAYEKAWKDYRNHRIIRIHNELHLEKSAWDSEVEPIRKQRQSSSYKNIKLMEEALNAKRCMSEIFEEAYAISESFIGEAKNKVQVFRACGGCRVCRRNGNQPFSEIMPEPVFIWEKPNTLLGEELERLLWNDNIMLIFYDSLEEKSTKSQMIRVIKWFVEQGIKNIIIPDDLEERFIKEINRIPNNFVFTWEKYQPIRMPRIPTLIFHPQGEKIPYNYLSKNSMQQTLKVILLSINTPDPTRQDRKLIDIFPGRHFKFEPFCTEIGI